MKKILIISDGETGKHFVNRVIQTYTSENIYYVVETKAVEHNEYNPARFKFYEFDPTSLHKLANLLKMDFVQVIILMNDENEAKYTLKN
ncbi:MAG: potassium transporter TrkA, partial [Thiovulaceae bacterium]|nr:potassium transporter TrkA [Sulfurimonadaceae bacterium]